MTKKYELYKQSEEVREIHDTYLPNRIDGRTLSRQRHAEHSLALLKHHLPAMELRDNFRARRTIAELERQLRTS